MRSRRSRRTLTHSWRKPKKRMRNDETISGDRYCRDDDPACFGGVMAISDCGCLRTDLAGTGGNSPSHGKERIQTQPQGTFTLDPALRRQHRLLHSVDLAARQIIDRRSSTVSPKNISTEYLGLAALAGG